jgi:hypothetical protein
MSVLPTPDFAYRMRLIGHTDQGGRGDGLQIMVHRGFAYVAHPWSSGFSIVDVLDPSRPVPVGFVAAPPKTWSIHLQTHDNLLLVVHALDLFADISFSDERAYYSGSIGETLRTVGHGGGSTRSWSSGMAIYDISKPSEPRQIGFFPVEGVGIHRIWYVGGRWAYVSALLYGFTDYILLVVDLADPQRPVEAGRYWLPGMNLAAGETPSWGKDRRFGLHHAVVSGDTAYACWRDGGLTVLDVSDRSAPRLIVHRNWAPPYGGGTHSALPLPDRNLLIVADEAVADNEADGRKHTWVFDVREAANPVSIATFPTPSEADYPTLGAHFGPHNLHENRPGSFVSSTMIFATWQNAGVRVFDISDPYRPQECGALVPAAPNRMIDHRPRPRVIQSADVFVDAQGLIYVTDNNAGLSIIEYAG